MNLVLRDNALRFSRSTDVPAEEHISEPLICRHRPGRERSRIALILLAFGIQIGGRHAVTLSYAGAKRNNSSAFGHPFECQPIAGVALASNHEEPPIVFLHGR